VKKKSGGVRGFVGWGRYRGEWEEKLRRDPLDATTKAGRGGEHWKAPIEGRSADQKPTICGVG